MDGRNSKVRRIALFRGSLSHKYLLSSSLMVLTLHATNHAFAKIPIGGHTVCACIAASVIGVCVSISLRSILDETIVPFEVVFVGIPSLILCDILFGMIKFIPVKDERTGQTKRWAIGM